MKLKIIITIFAVLGLFFLNFSLVEANGDRNNSDKPVILQNPLGAQDLTPNALIGQLINGVLGIVGSLALVMFIYGGFTWMLAAGDSGKVQKGKDILIWATIGLVVIFSAYAMVKFVLTGITGV